MAKHTMLLAMVLVLGVSCASPSAGTIEPLAGTYYGSGSGAGLEQMQALTKRFKELHPGVEFKLDDAGSETGIALVSQGQIDFGFVSRDLYPDEVGKVALTPLSGAGTAIAVNSANPVPGLTKRQVRDIFSGAITDWGAVGGPAGHRIVPIVREPESATRATFEQYFFDGAKPSYPTAINVVESKEAYSQIRLLKDSIAMVTLQTSTQNDVTLRLLALDGVAATTANVGNGTYPIRRPVFMFTSTDDSKISPAVRALVEFIKSAEGIQILATF